MSPDELIEKWARSGGAENANAQHFTIDLCDMLGVERPAPSEENDARNPYVFERSVTHVERGVTSKRRIDCYKRDHFILESKQSSTRGSRAAKNPDLGDLLPEDASAVKGGAARRGTAAWDRSMRRAYAQAREYVGDLPADHAAPPFLIVVDVGYVIELYADFSGQGRNYTQFPGRADFQIALEDLGDEAVRERLRAVWTDPHALDPAIRSAEVTRDVAERLARVAQRLEGRHDPGTVATFLMRCLFTMFAEDVELIARDSFTDLLEGLRDNEGAFVLALEHLWQTMDEGGFEPRTAATLRRFNGSLFKERTALPLDREGIHELWVAAKQDWRHVEPAIFGTLLERALDPRERSKLGAHYTPRAYVERLVVPTVIEPLREEWEEASARMAELVDGGEAKEAFEVARAFHHQLCTTRVLDPACGTGNFLYVALELMKKLEGEVLEAMEALGTGQASLAMRGETVDPSQFLGLEINPRAVPIAELVLWVGFLKWQLRTGGLDAVGDPVLHAYGTIEHRDAVLDYDRRELRTDEAGRPVTTWDGFTHKDHPVTGLPVPDETARVEAYTYKNPRKAEWPEAEFIVGNPPFIGGKDMRAELGDGYAEAVWKARPDVPGGADFVMQWWDEAATLLARKGTKTAPNPLRRFGFITTNSITQTFSRRVVEKALAAKVPVSLAHAVPDHPWVKGAGRAAVRIAMTVARRGRREGVLAEVVAERELNSDAPVVVLDRKEGFITPKLTQGADVTKAEPLLANEGLSSPGVKLHGSGFIVTTERARALGLGTVPGLENHILDYRNGRDLAQRSRGVKVIDLYGLDANEVRERFPDAYAHVADEVRPHREARRGASKDADEYADKWWLFGKIRTELRGFLDGLPRYIVTIETTKHRVFRFLDASVRPDNMLVAVGSDRAEALAVLSSRLHVAWSLEAGGTLEDRPRYNKSRILDPFPFPAIFCNRKYPPPPPQPVVSLLHLIRVMTKRCSIGCASWGSGWRGSGASGTVRCPTSP